MIDPTEIAVNFARLGVAADPEAVRRYIRRVIRLTTGVREYDSLRSELGRLLVSKGGAMRSMARAPVDASSFQSLMRSEDVADLEPPLLAASVQVVLDQIVEEHRQGDALIAAGMEPTRSVLLVGSPGVGKTMTARYLAQRLELPLLTLDLAAVMSSFLGRTGQNLRSVLDHARSNPCVLFLDEFDALAKRRDDPTDIGELKRIVNVLLIEIERWPSHGLLVAATNHPEILDKAVERRFGRTLVIPVPTADLRRAMIERALASAPRVPQEAEPALKSTIVEIAVLATEGLSGSLIARLMHRTLRDVVLSKTAAHEALLENVRSVVRDRAIEQDASDLVGRRAPGRKAAIPPALVRSVSESLVLRLGMPYREVADLIGVSHMTVARAAAAAAASTPKVKKARKPKSSRS